MADAVIYLDVPEWQIGQDVMIYFPDTMVKHGKCELLKEQPEIVRCKDCKYRSYYCTEATDGTTLYTCHHPCSNSVPRPGDWFCADGEAKS